LIIISNNNIFTTQFIFISIQSKEFFSIFCKTNSNISSYLYGQPTHSFDADKITGNITIRFAKDGEKFLALNVNEYELSSEDIVIADDNQVLALGGVIG
jgi:hypothetical protein